MTRVRISTTVDGERLEACRRLAGGRDARLIDRALALLLDTLEADREQAALEAMPYHDDPDLSWEAPSGPVLPYSGEVPVDVKRLAAARRRHAR